MLHSALHVALTGVRGGAMAGMMTLMTMMIMISRVSIVIIMTRSYNETTRPAAPMIMVAVNSAHTRLLQFKLLNGTGQTVFLMYY